METMQKPAWLKMTEADLKKIIAELAKNNPQSKIGIILRDQYGVPSTRLYGKKLGAYLKELGIETIEEFENAKKKMERLKENITDKKAKHKYQKAQSRYSLLKRHYSIE